MGAQVTVQEEPPISLSCDCVRMMVRTMLRQPHLPARADRLKRDGLSAQGIVLENMSRRVLSEGYSSCSVRLPEKQPRGRG